MKMCNKCNVLKPLNDYYKHSKMLDGHLNFCKECVKKRVGKHRVDNIEKIREYDRDRPNKKQRYKQNSERLSRYREERKNDVSKLKIDGRNWDFSQKEKTYATVVLKRAVDSGLILKPNYCADCENYFEDKTELQGHHEDYNLKTCVIWLCPKCHNKLHSFENAIPLKNYYKYQRNDFD